jgi:hypothetical protein
MRRILLLWPALLPLISGCPPTERPRLNAPPQGDSQETPTVMGENFAYHNDQGMLADMSIADLHFVPHGTELSGVGIARLERYAELLASSGGTIHYSTSIRDPEMASRRVSVANNFLRQSIPGSRPIVVVLGLPGGRGMPGKEAILDQAVARQPEPRAAAYHLAGSETEAGGTGK